MPMVRKDNSDVIYRTLPEKWEAVVEEIKTVTRRDSPRSSALCRSKTLN